MKDWQLPASSASITCIMRFLFWLSAILMTGTYICGPVHDVDLWWHIVAGRWIIANGSIPFVDYWNAFGAGKPWIAYSWLFEAVIAGIEHAFSSQGLYATKITLGITLAASLSLLYSRVAHDKGFGLLLGMFACTACHNHFTLRPQSLVWICFALVLLVAEDIKTNGLNIKNRIFLILIMSLWANTHLTQALGLFAVCTWIIDKDNWQNALEASLYAFFGTLLTPYGGYEWIIFFTKSSHPAMFNAIAEFKPATLLQYPTVFLFLISIIALTFIHKRPRQLRYGQYMFAAMYVFAGLVVLKFIPFAVISVCALVAGLWNVQDKKTVYGNLAEGLQKLKDFLCNAPMGGSTFLMLVLAFLNVYPVWHQPVIPQRTPINAVHFMRGEQLPGPIMNDFGRGGYLAYRYSDSNGVTDEAVSIDGRTNVNPVEIWNASHAAFTGQHTWHTYFDIVEPGTVLWPTESPLTTILLQKETWCRVYQTGNQHEGYSVFVHKDFFITRADSLTSDNC